MEKNIKIILPITPNFIKLRGVDTVIPISEFSQEELTEIGREWTAELIKKAKYKQND